MATSVPVPIAIPIHRNRVTMSNIRQNLFFAFIYKAPGIPLAAGWLYPLFGVLLSPIIAGAAMSLSSVSVIAYALRLRNVKLRARSKRMTPATAEGTALSPRQSGSHTFT
jgi:cation transport ATPase